MFMNMHVMIIISANLPANHLFDKESNIEHKGAGMALLKSSTKYSPELLYHQQSHYFALFAISHYFFSSPSKFVSKCSTSFSSSSSSVPQTTSSGLTALLSSPTGWNQFSITWVIRAYLAVEPSRAPLTPGRGWQVLSRRSRDGHRLPWLVPTSSQVNPWA